MINTQSLDLDSLNLDLNNGLESWLLLVGFFTNTVIIQGLLTALQPGPHTVMIQGLLTALQPGPRP
jgi:hypothetical protein